MPSKSDKSSAKSKFLQKRILFVFCLILIIIIVIINVQKINKIQQTADTLGAKVDWQAIMTSKPPFYLLEHKAVRIQYDDAQLFKENISRLGIEIDPWEVYRYEAIAGVSKQNLQKLTDNGFAVTVLANSYEEYFNSPQFKVNRGERIGSD